MAHSALVCRPVLLEQIVGVGLRGRLGIGFIEQILDTEKDLLDGDRGSPCLLLVQDRETDGAGGVDVGVEQRWRELACIATNKLAIVHRKHTGPFKWVEW